MAFKGRRSATYFHTVMSDELKTDTLSFWSIFQKCHNFNISFFGSKIENHNAAKIFDTSNFLSGGPLWIFDPKPFQWSKIKRAQKNYNLFDCVFPTDMF